MKVLILSCNTGGGHNAAASALKESLNFDNVVITNMFEIADAEEE